MNHDPVLIGSALTLRRGAAGDAEPATLSVRLTGRIFQALYVQIAGAENVEAAGGRHPLQTQRIALHALAGPVRVRVYTTRPPARTEVELELTIDDGEPAGPFLITRQLGTLSPDAAEHCLDTTLDPRSLTRP